jgi:hypothetical protein
MDKLSMPMECKNGQVRITLSLNQNLLAPAGKHIFQDPLELDENDSIRAIQFLN